MGEVSLREYIESLLEERQKAQDLQWQSAQRALEAADAALRVRLERMNEFRAQIQEERALYVRRDQLEPILQRLQEAENTESNLGGRFWMLAIVLTCGASLLTAGLVLFIKHLAK